MDEFDRQLSHLSAAEEFFHFLGVPFEQSVVNVNRLHILKRFNQYLRRDGRGEQLDAEARVAHYRGLLCRAYEDFVRSSPAQEKVFKVFQDADGRSVSLDAVRATLPSQRGEPADGRVVNS
ncbi:MAG: nitrogenase stabilizing/protective protein NifW [Nevskiales bacterium]|nr:nitrogenase stabilizing/protective protein NifW [Nevskiales bacterium]